MILINIRLKASTPEIFKDTKLQFEVFKLLEFYSYKAPPRRFCYQIFGTHWKPEDITDVPSNTAPPIISNPEETHIVHKEQSKTKRRQKKPPPTPERGSVTQSVL